MGGQAQIIRVGEVDAVGAVSCFVAYGTMGLGRSQYHAGIRPHTRFLPHVMPAQEVFRTRLQIRTRGAREVRRALVQGAAAEGRNRNVVLSKHKENTPSLVMEAQVMKGACQQETRQAQPKKRQE
jgi:hypothetical protein